MAKKSGIWLVKRQLKMFSYESKTSATSVFLPVSTINIKPEALVSLRVYINLSQ